MNSVMIDTRLKRKVEGVYKHQDSYSVRFVDLIDTFWFSDSIVLQEFLNEQASERYYDKKLRKGYFDYINEHNETLRYYVTSNRGKLTVTKEENLGVIN